MTSLDGMRPAFDMGRVVSRTFGAIGRNFVVFFGLSLLLGALPTIVLGYVQSRLLADSLGDLRSFAFSGNWFLVMCLRLVVGVISTYTLQAALVHGTVADLNGRKASLGECLSTGLRFILPLFAIGFLMSLGLVVGFTLLVVPGLIMLTVWSVTVPAEVIEKTGVLNAFSRSVELTRGNRWPVFGLLLVYGIVVWLVSLVAAAVSGVFSASLAHPGVMPSLSLPFIISTGVINSLAMMIGAAGAASLYYELRSSKEGVGVSELAKVFE